MDEMICDNPVISVIVPVYKVEEYLDECVVSIVNQTYRNLEIILVDDGSPDSCPQKCDSWAEKDSRIRVIHKKNGGLSSARNAGVNIATGDYIGFVDSDDFIDAKMYDKLFEGFSLAQNVGVASVKIYRYDNGAVGEYNKKWNFDEPQVVQGSAYSKKMVSQMCCHTACNKLYKTDVCRKISFWEGRNNEDTLYQYYLGKVMRDDNLILVEMPYFGYYYRIRPESICTTAKVPLAVDVIKNLDEMIADARTFDNDLADELDGIRLKTLYSFLDAMIINPIWKPIYYKDYRELFTQMPNSSIIRALRPNDACYALMHKYCPELRMMIRKVLKASGRYDG